MEFNNWHKNWLVFGINTFITVLTSFLQQLAK